VSRPAPAPEDDAIVFAEKVFALLDETRKTATYKLAVLLGLMDLCLEKVAPSGGPPEVVTTRELAEKVMEIYWPHALPFGSGKTAAVLRQATGGQAEILSLIEKARSSLGDVSVPLMKVRISAARTYSRLLDQIEWKLIEMPLPRLQTIGTTADPFLYQINWDKSVRYRDIVCYQKEHSGFDNRIILKPRVGEHLVRLNGLLRPLIHRRWAAMVAALNGQEDSRLEQFLFGTDRINLSVTRIPLWELQEERCFYCDARIREPKQSHVDHFIPWSRYQENGLSNLVIADPKCNSDKSDFLAATEHMERWLDRFRDTSRMASGLRTLADAIKWDLSPQRTLNVGRGLYVRLRNDVKLWRLGRDFVNADPVRIRRSFSALGNNILNEQ
jgi:5-methylcytosine-specific restriction endonuclease McrA